MDSSKASVLTASKNLKQIRLFFVRRQLACLDNTTEVCHEIWYSGSLSHYVIAILNNNLNLQPRITPYPYLNSLTLVMSGSKSRHLNVFY